MTILTIFDHFDNVDNFFLAIKNLNSNNNCYLTINRDTGQHSHLFDKKCVLLGSNISKEFKLRKETHGSNFCNFQSPSCIASFLTELRLYSWWVNIPVFERLYNIDQIDSFTSTIAKFEVFIAAMHWHRSHSTFCFVHSLNSVKGNHLNQDDQRWQVQ